MDVIKLIALIVLIGAVMALVISCMLILVDKITSYVDYRNSKKWVVNDYPMPNELDENKNKAITRSIEITPGVFTFTFSIEKHKAVRTYRYRNTKEAAAKYALDFINEELAFIDRYKDVMTEEVTNKHLIQELIKTMDTITARADRIESDLNQLKGKDNV